MVLSTLGMWQLVGMARLLVGGALAGSVRWVVLGILLSVFVHAFVELVASFGVMSDVSQAVVMGALLSLGSACFIRAGIVGKRALRGDG